MSTLRSSPRIFVGALNGLVALLLCASAGAGVPTLHQPALEPHTFHIQDPTPTRDVYRSLGETWGLYVVFDADLPKGEITIDLQEMMAAEAFARVTHAAGHFYLITGERSIFVAEDTPEKRRYYEAQILRMFRIEHIDVRDVGRLFSHLLELEHTAAYDEDGVVLVRGTAAQIETAAVLVEAVDQPRGEIELDVEVLLLEGADLAAAKKILLKTRGRTRFPSRLDTDELDGLRSLAHGLAESGLVVLDRDTAHWQLQRELVATGAEAATFELGLKLSVRPRIHTGSDVTLEVSTDWTDLARPTPVPEAVEEVTRQEEPRETNPHSPLGEIKEGRHWATGTVSGEWSSRLRSGEPLLISGILPDVERRGMMAERLGAASAENKLLLILTPWVARSRVAPEDDFEIICAVATGLTGLCGGAVEETP